MNQLLDVFYFNWHIVILFYLVAILYASAGFGGGSSYLAILALSSLAFTEIRSISLLCNIVVVSSGSYIFNQKGLINWRKILPLIMISMPLAFVGGLLSIEQAVYFIILGFSLILAAGLMLLAKFKDKEMKKMDGNLLQDLFFGSGIGFLSGVVGIGGGIFLAPLLHITQWDTAKNIAATTSVFILLNSLSGLLGQVLNSDFSLNLSLTSTLLVTVFVGGQIGSRISTNILSQVWIKRITALLIAVVGVRILLSYF